MGPLLQKGDKQAHDYGETIKAKVHFTILCFSEQLKLVRVSWITFNLPRAATQELFYLSH